MVSDTRAKALFLCLGKVVNSIVLKSKNAFGGGLWPTSVFKARFLVKVPDICCLGVSK